MTRRAILSLLALAATTLGPRPGAAPGDDAVSRDEIAATVRFLSSPELSGRGAAEPGGAVASAYVASRLEALGLLPCGDPGSPERAWFQSVPALQATYDRAGSRLEVVAAPSSRVTLLDGARPGFRTLPDRAESV